MTALFSVGFPTGMEGLTYPIPFSNPEDLVSIAQRAETLGYHSVWGNDHMTTQHYVRAEFPVPPRFWEPLVTYAFLAAHTTKLRFGTGVLVLPMRRDIVVTAKQIITLDHLSNGRAEIGVGIGAYREEFEALNPDGKVHRGDMVQEGVEALRLLFSQREASFDGKYYKFKDVELFPKPKQTRLPIYFGGNNKAHLQRTAESGDGWIPAALPHETLRRMVAELKEMTEEAGRKFSDLQIAPQYIVHVGRDHDKAIARFRQSQMFKHLESLKKSTLKGQASLNFEDINLVGGIDAVISRGAALREAGVTHFLGLFFAVNSVSELLDQMQFFAEEVRPKIP
ncbi:MAG: TIGR03619 family F420-dependent LLM class oxidoreductase [Xanthobacteraceae bacterium]